ncbi:MAG: GNAT family N-acetyltransferase [Candidatus Bathyarchaeia archaeon]
MIVRRLSLTELSKLHIAAGFSRWVSTDDAKGKIELKRKLKKFISEKKDVWCAVDNGYLIGYGIVDDLAELPGGKTLETLEVAQNYRRRGIGSIILNRILGEYGEALMAVVPFPEFGYEKELEEFYRRHGFKKFSEDLMFRFPSDAEKLRKWITYLDELLDTYKTLRKKMASELPSSIKFNPQ